MARRIPPWYFITSEDGKPVIPLGSSDYPVETEKPPAFFLPTYVQTLFSEEWFETQEARLDSERHPVAKWAREFDAFLVTFEARGLDAEYRDLITPATKSFLALAYNLYCLDHDRLLQDVLVDRLKDISSFQGALHELAVAATMTRANFALAFEDEEDSSRKHPEFIATHRGSGISVAVEAKSIHRSGVLGGSAGAPPPTIHSGSAHKVAAQVCGQVERALPKANGVPLFVFVDLNLPRDVAEAFAPELVEELATILPEVDQGLGENGEFVGRTMNLLVVTNQPMHLDETGHHGGETLNAFITPPASDCRFPEGSTHIDDVKAALEQFGTVPGP